MKISSKLLLLGAVTAVGGSLQAQTTGFTGTAAGPYDYNNTSNWVGNTINGIWDSSLTLTAAQQVTFGANTPLTTGLTFNHAGNFALTLRGTGANRTLTLGGDVSVNTSGGASANVTIGSSSANQGLSVDLGATTRTISVASARTLNFVNTVSNGSINKTGAGSLTLSGSNTFSGGVTLDSGILNINNDAALGTGALTINSGSINVNAARNITHNNALNLNGNFTFVGSNTLNLGNGPIALAAPITLTTTASTLTMGGTISGGSIFDITKAGAGTLVYTNNTALNGATTANVTAGALMLTGNVTGAHPLTINGAGALGFRGATANAASSAITANAGSSLTFDSGTAGVTGATRAASVTLRGASLNVIGNSGANSNDTITGALTVGAPSAFGVAGANTVSVTADPAANAKLTADRLVRANNGAVYFRGTNLGVNPIASNTAGSSNIVFSGSAPTLVGGGGAAGTQNISIIPWAVGSSAATGAPTGFVTYDANGIRVLAANEYDTTIPASASTNNVRLSGTSPTLTVNGATTVNSLFLTNATTGTTVLAGTGALTVTSGAIYADFTLGGNNNVLTVSKAIDFGTAEGVIGTMGTSSSKTLSFSGGISGSGGVTIYDAGAVSSNQAGVSFGAANSYTGNTVINGSLIVSNLNALPNFTNASRTGDVYVNGTLGVSGNTSIRMNGLYGSGRIITPFSSNATVIVGDNNATSTFDGIITQTSGAVTLNKIGTGTLTLTNSGNNYTGNTTVSAGTLLVTGGITNSAITVSAAGTLAGAGNGTNTGIIGGATTLSAGAKLSPGAAAGLAGNLTFLNGLNLSASSNNTGAYLFNLGATSASDRITLTSVVANALNLGILDVEDFTFTTGLGFGVGTYVLFDANSTILGSIGTDTVVFGGGLTGTLSIDAINNDVLLTVVPEPVTGLLLLGGLGACVALRRRRQ